MTPRHDSNRFGASSYACLVLLGACWFTGYPAPLAATSKPFTQSQPQPQHIELDTGHAKVIPIRGVSRIAVGNSQIVQAKQLSTKEIILFGKQVGSTSVDVWTPKGHQASYRVQVRSAEIARAHQEILSLLADYPQAHTKIVGQKIVIEGQHLSDQTRSFIKDLASRYPNLIDFTGQLGWDQMVLVDVKVLELPTSKMKELGIRWDPTSQGGVYSGLAWQGHSQNVGTPTVAQPLESLINQRAPAAALGVNALLSARLHALTQQGQAITLAQPQLLTRSGSAASFLAGGEVPYATTDKDGKSTTTFRKYGVSLKVTPHVDATGAIRAVLEVEVSSVDPSIQTQSGPAMKVRKASTEFNVQSGQTLVLGGFVSREKSSDQSAIPGLSNLPGLGGLFGVTQLASRHTELTIFVTPVLVNAQHPDLLERIDQARHIIQSEFPEPDQLQRPVDPSQSEHAEFDHPLNQNRLEFND